MAMDLLVKELPTFWKKNSKCTGRGCKPPQRFLGEDDEFFNFAIFGAIL